jgi:hypothetical protein
MSASASPPAPAAGKKLSLEDFVVHGLLGEGSYAKVRGAPQTDRKSARA